MSQQFFLAVSNETPLYWKIVEVDGPERQDGKFNEKDVFKQYDLPFNLRPQLFADVIERGKRFTNASFGWTVTFTVWSLSQTEYKKFRKLIELHAGYEEYLKLLV